MEGEGTESEAGLEVALRVALQPKTLKERVLFRIGGGLTAAQVYDRLPEELRERLGKGAANAEVGRRMGVGRVHRALNGLSERGEIRRERSSFGVMLASKGHRKVVVDVYR